MFIRIQIKGSLTSIPKRNGPINAITNVIEFWSHALIAAFELKICIAERMNESALI